MKSIVFARNTRDELFGFAKVTLIVLTSMSIIGGIAASIAETQHDKAKTAFEFTPLYFLALTIGAPLLENSFVFLLGHIIRRLFLSRFSLVFFASIISFAFIATHIVMASWVAIGTAPFALVLSFSAVGLFWYERGFKWAFYRLFLLHSIINSTLFSSIYFSEILL